MKFTNKIKKQKGYKKSLTILMPALLIAIFALVSSFPQTTKAADTITQTILTSAWNPPSPDPSGIAFHPITGKLIISDGEVDEMTIFEGKNVYEASTNGDLQNTFTTTAFSNEPTGIAVDPFNNRMFFTDDDKDAIFEVNLGADGAFNTADDSVRTVKVTNYGINDAEGIAYGQGRIFVSDGVGTEIFEIDPGPNGIFDAIDDIVSHFDTTNLNQGDPEGVEYNPDNNTLFIVSNNNRTEVAEVTRAGKLVRKIDITAAGARKPAGIAYGTSSTDPNAKSLYIVDRGIDNDTDPKENDGKTYEILLGDTVTPTPTPTLDPNAPTPTPTLEPTPTPQPDTEAPIATVTYPTDGSAVVRNTTITITASASDNVGISKVEFMVNGNLVCTDTTISYTCSWGVPGKPKASYTITAKAYDTAGNIATHSVQVSVATAR